MDREEILQKLQGIINEINKNNLRLLCSVLNREGNYEFHEVLINDLHIIDGKDITPFDV